jgi:predicted ATPase
VGVEGSNPFCSTIFASSSLWETWLAGIGSVLFSGQRPWYTVLIVLTRIFADNFRALVNFELRPGRLSLLLGDNGSGKTSVLNMLGSLRDLIVLGRSSTDVFSYSRTKWEVRDVQRFELDFESSNGTYHYVLEIQHPQGSHEKPLIRSESVNLDVEPLYRFSDGEVHLFYDDHTSGPGFPFRSDQSFLTSLDSARAPRMGRLGEFKEFVTGLSIIQPNPFAMEPESKHDQNFLSRNGGNFASFFEYLNAERPEVRAALEVRLGEALPGFRNLMFRRLGDTKLLLAVFGDGKHRGEFTLAELSEGQRVLAVLYAAVFGLLRRGSVLCFDEPDNFVSLPEIQPWLQTLRDALEEKGGQALIISHHPEVIDYLALDSIWRFERPSGPVIARSLEVNGAPDLKLSEIIARGA